MWGGKGVGVGWVGGWTEIVRVWDELLWALVGIEFSRCL